MLRSTSSDSYWKCLATLAYKTKLLSKSGRTFLTPAHLFCPIICSAPHSSSPKVFTQVHFSWDALVVLFVDTVSSPLLGISPDSRNRVLLSFKFCSFVTFSTKSFLSPHSHKSIHDLCCVGTLYKTVVFITLAGCFCMMFPCCDSSWIDSVIWVFGSFFVKFCLV